MYYSVDKCIYSMKIISHLHGIPLWILTPRDLNFFYMCIYSMYPLCLSNVHKANFFPFKTGFLFLLLQKRDRLVCHLHQWADIDFTHIWCWELATNIFIQSTLIQSISWQFLPRNSTCAAIAPLPPNVCLGTLASFFPTVSAHHQSHYFHTSWWQSRRLRFNKSPRDE